MAAARSSPRRAAMVEEEQEEVHELQEGDFTVEVVQAAGEEAEEEEGVILTELKVSQIKICFLTESLPLIFVHSNCIETLIYPERRHCGRGAEA